MRRTETPRAPSALLAFGQRVSADDAFDRLVETRGWQVERWRPTFVEGPDRLSPPLALPGTPAPDRSWERRQVLRRPADPASPRAADSDQRLMVADAAALPTLYFVEWHYIDFVLSCLGSVSETARVLGIRRSTLQRKRKKMPPLR